MFLILLSLLIGSVNAQSQKYANSQFTLFSYEVSINERIKTELSPYENLITYKPQGKQDKIEGMLIHTLYSLASNILTDTLKIFILPVGSLTDKAKYNSYGYPEINIRKVIKLADTKYFLKIEAIIENDIIDLQTKKENKNIFRPKIIVKIDIFNKDGYLPIQSSVGSAEATSSVNITPEFIAGMNFMDDSVVKKQNMETLRDIMARSITEAIIKIKYKGGK